MESKVRGRQGKRETIYLAVCVCVLFGRGRRRRRLCRHKKKGKKYENKGGQEKKMLKTCSLLCPFPLPFGRITKSHAA